jgi:hypothetical protein
MGYASLEKAMQAADQVAAQGPTHGVA